MYKHILLGVDTQIKNEKALKEVSRLARNYRHSFKCH